MKVIYKKFCLIRNKKSMKPVIHIGLGTIGLIDFNKGIVYINK